MVRVLIVCALVLAGCGTAASEQPRPEKRNHDRVVRMSGGEALSYVHSDTASQVLCSALPDEKLRRVLAATAVVRERHPDGAKGTCRIRDDRGSKAIDLSLHGVWDRFAPSARIAGRPAQINVNTKVVIDVAIAETDGYRTASKRTPILRAQGPVSIDMMVRGLLDELVPVLAEQTDELPQVDEDGTVAFSSTPLTADEFVDLPRPMQVLQLCTVAEQVLHLEVVRAIDTGTCTLRRPDGRTLALVVVDSVGSEQLTEKVAGRPARFGESTITVRLRDDALLDLMIGDTDPKLAEQLVRALGQG
ncbi:hypothetical protein KIPE111705_27290 [Kibdelosporangium persicum]|uniref:Uncharacterized protein n=1 Tax=Kibdelosporangium persicum TaxID=2698649 RepID=A0ABX2EX04_9PSEU|nr:hypothetical protein [Kibdelosporangium persicum]NRN63301.1 hypothetical protein [Kibdelosporangium persicum]